MAYGHPGGVIVASRRAFSHLRHLLKKLITSRVVLSRLASTRRAAAGEAFRATFRLPSDFTLFPPRLATYRACYCRIATPLEQTLIYRCCLQQYDAPRGDARSTSAALELYFLLSGARDE